MQATLTFTLPEESEEHKCAVNGMKYYCGLQEVLELIRGKLKHGQLPKEQENLLEEIRNLILEEISDDN